MTDLSGASRSELLDRALTSLLSQAPEIEAAAVVSFDGLPMASALPASMDEDRVAAMSAALLSLGERAAEGLGRGELSQVYIEGETGTVFLVSADNEAVLVAVAAQGAKAGLMLYEVRRAAAAVADALRDDEPVAPEVPHQVAAPVAEPVAAPVAEPHLAAVPDEPALAAVPAEPAPSYVSPLDSTWSSSYAPSGSTWPATGANGTTPSWS
ncbi:MAG TPA: roadblock/LC7 domain-containing protein [Mycobacteriales bacterium]|nr:roadblock/LC7 domain-containing protein [Mycobacteriales bacterium]